MSAPTLTTSASPTGQLGHAIMTVWRGCSVAEALIPLGSAKTGKRSLASLRKRQPSYHLATMRSSLLRRSI